MPCKHFQSALTDAAASGAPMPELRQHLKTCSDCHSAFLAEQNLFASIDSTLHAQANADIPPALVSRLHARIFVENGQYMLEDENSTNFTFLNRQRLAAKTPTPLHDNDEIKLGRVLLRFKTL